MVCPHTFIQRRMIYFLGPKTDNSHSNNTDADNMLFFSLLSGMRKWVLIDLTRSNDDALSATALSALSALTLATINPQTQPPKCQRRRIRLLRNNTWPRRRLTPDLTFQAHRFRHVWVQLRGKASPLEPTLHIVLAPRGSED